MKTSVLFMSLVILVVVGTWGIIPTDAASPASKDETSLESKSNTRTIIADLLMVDGDFYVVRGEHGEIHIEATPTTDVTEEFDYGDRIKAAVLPNDKALSIRRAVAGDVPGVSADQQTTP